MRALQAFPSLNWIGGALQWHFTFMWVFAATGVLSLAAQAAPGHYRTVWFHPRDVRYLWPMIRHYFLFGRRPQGHRAAVQPATEAGARTRGDGRDRGDGSKSLTAEGLRPEVLRHH